ncbi:MAG: helix-turn-helix transcriptional regulator [Alteromonadaceae bacterium]|nr:helix-turn-helix transcriptional regulator [Alteromonadaceae bacterium]
MKFSEKIKQLRNKAGLTQPELAKRSDIEQSYLSKLENDKGSPSFDVISKIAVALNTDAMTLIESLDLQYIPITIQNAGFDSFKKHIYCVAES